MPPPPRVWAGVLAAPCRPALSEHCSPSRPLPIDRYTPHSSTPALGSHSLVSNAFPLPSAALPPPAYWHFLPSRCRLATLVPERSDTASAPRASPDSSDSQ